MKEDYPVQLIVRTLNVIFEIRDRHRFEYNATHSRDAEGRTLEAQMSVIRYYYFTLFHSPIIFSHILKIPQFSLWPRRSLTVRTGKTPNGIPKTC